MTPAPRVPQTVIAVDWSGAKQGAQRRIWLAEIREGAVVRLESGRTREEVIAYLIAMAQLDQSLLVGLDFAFGFPAWFAHTLVECTTVECTTIDHVWEVALRAGDAWVQATAPPFWGRPGIPRPPLDDARPHFRKTEMAARGVVGTHAKSVFQVGGAGSVGTGSIRGMPLLPTLRRAGFAVWPFDAPDPPVAVEIYPRHFTGPVVKSDARARGAYLVTHHPSLPLDTMHAATTSEDAFDAVVTALGMWRYRETVAHLTIATDPEIALEGWIWDPVGRG